MNGNQKTESRKGKTGGRDGSRLLLLCGAAALIFAVAIACLMFTPADDCDAAPPDPPQYVYKDGVKYLVIEAGLPTYLRAYDTTQDFTGGDVVLGSWDDYEVTEIGEGAFFDCSTITSVTIDNLVKNILPSAFAECSLMTSFTVSGDNSQLTNIEPSAFEECTSLKTFTVGNPGGLNNLTEIGDKAFKGCVLLESFELPKNLTTLGICAFQGCEALTITVHAENLHFKVDTGGKSLYNEPKTILLWHSPASTTYTVPIGVTTIGDSALKGSKLTEVKIHNYVATISDNAFADSLQLKIVYLGGGQTVSATAFSNCSVDLFVVDGSPNNLHNVAGGSANVIVASSIGVMEANKNASWGYAVVEVQANGEVKYSLPGGVATATIEADPGFVAFWSDYGVTDNKALTDGTDVTAHFFEPGAISPPPLVVNGIKYEAQVVDKDVKLSVVQNAYAGVITLPAPWNGFSDAGTYAFSVTAIGVTAFNQSDVTKVTIPSTVKSIGNRAFYMCSKLTAVTIAEGSVLETIGDESFCGSGKLESFNLPKSVTTIGGQAFYRSKISEFHIPADSLLETINAQAFMQCIFLGSIALPASVGTVGGRAFEDCRVLSVTVHANNSTYSSEGGALYDKEKNLLIWYPCKSTELVLPGTVKHIGAYAVAYSKIAEAKIPTGVESVMANAFFKSASLKIVHLGSGTTFNNTAFSDCSVDLFVVDGSPNNLHNVAGGSANVIVASSIGVSGTNKNAGWGYAVVNKVGAGDLTYSVDAGVAKATAVPDAGHAALWSDGTAAADAALADAMDITAYFIGVTVDAEFEHNGIKYRVVASGADKKVGLSVMPKTPIYSGGIVLPGPWNGYAGTDTYEFSVTAIGENAFKSCTDLTSVSIPSTVKTIGNMAFYMSNLATVTFTGTSQLETIGENAFRGTRLTSFELPGTVTKIGVYAFYECTSMTEFIIPAASGLVTLGAGAFVNCSALPSITLPASLPASGLGHQIFFGCSVLGIEVDQNNASLKIVNGVLYEYDSTGVTELVWYPTKLPATEFTVPDTVKRIRTAAFSFAEADVTVPASVEQINWGAFDWFKGKEVRILGPATLGSNTFASSTLEVLRMHGGTAVSANTFGSCTIALILVEGDAVPDFNLMPDGTKIRNVVSVADPVTKKADCNYAKVGGGDHASVTYSVENPSGDVWIAKATAVPDEGYAFGKWSNGATTATLAIEDGMDVTACILGTIVDSPFEYEGFKYKVMTSSADKKVGLNVMPKTPIYSGDITLPGPWNGYAGTDTYEFSVTAIGNEAFKNCTELMSVTISSTVETIGKEAFSGCTGLKTVTFTGAGLKTIDENAFLDTAIVSFELPASVTSIKNGAFRNCGSLTVFDIPEESKLTAIGIFSFLNCVSLQSIVLPAHLSEIGYPSFYKCLALDVTVHPDNTTFKVDEGVLYKHAAGVPRDLVWYPPKSLAESFEVPSTVAIIQNGAFAYSKLSEVIIPDGIILKSEAFIYSSVKLVRTQSVQSMTFSAFRYCDIALVVVDGGVMPDNLPVFKDLADAPIGMVVSASEYAEDKKKVGTDYAVVRAGNHASVEYSIENTSGDVWIAKATAVPNEGYAFGKWSDGKTDTTITLEGVMDITALMACVVKFDNGGVVETKNAIEGDEIAMPEPTREGHTLDGWMLGEELRAKGTLLPVTGNATLFAQWTPKKYTITFDSAEGTPVDPITRDYGTTVTAPKAPTRVGHGFVGWKH
ncbi:MAG: leucine-rich repeat protein, partial [Thermoplasmatales archaeon]|nr:leucine-rich repeat protein [Thermoplasmatales archaeon]